MPSVSSVFVRVALLAVGTLTFGIALAGAGKPEFQCNNGDLVIRRVADVGTSARYEAEITNPGVVAYILDQSTKYTQPTISGYAWDGWVQKTLPRTVSVLSSSAGQTLLISELQIQNFGDAQGFVSGQYAPTIRPEQQGMRVEITNAKMLGSHTLATWEVANWRFESCASIVP